MKTKTLKNIQKILSTSTKNQTALNNIFANLPRNYLSKKDKEVIHIRLDQLEQLALAIKAKL